MATTSPDNLWSPDPTGNYNLVADLATMQTSAQTALVKRANMYVGTAAQRTAFTTAAEGVHWQDTTGDKLEYVRQGGAWTPSVVPVQEIPITTFGAGWNGFGGLHAPRLIVSADGRVDLVGLVGRTTATGAFTNLFTVPSEFLPQPSGTLMLGAFFFSGGFGGQLSLQPSGVVRLEYSFGTPALTMNISLSGTWVKPSA